jgi:hypothetical protein
MITKFRIGAAGVAIISAMGMANSANAATASATADAVILAPLTVTNTDNLDFGTVAVNGAGTVAVSSGGTRTCSANLVCSGTPSAAAFTVAGAASVNVSIGYQNITTLTSGANSMVLSNLSNSAGGTLALNGSGAGAFTVGGDLAVAANQAAGTYQGSFQVVVLYQ